MKPYAELLEFNQPSPRRKEGFTRIRDSFPGLKYMNGSFYDPERITEFSGRWDYGSKNAEKLGQPSKDGKKMIQKWVASGEQSMLEMGHATVFIECSRVVSHELVRHRLASFQQESQRFTKYDEEDPEDLFYTPPEINDDVRLYDEWDDGEYGTTLQMDPGLSAKDMYDEANAGALRLYRDMREKGIPPQIARYIFPNATRTRMIVSANMREWRHIIKLRLHSSAQPEMRELMQQIYDQLAEVFPQSLEGVLEGERGIR